MSSALARTEVLRALLLERRSVSLAAGQASFESTRTGQNGRVLKASGPLPADLSSLDAIHLATTQQLGRDLGQVVTYDERMIDAARQLGINTASPS